MSRIFISVDAWRSILAVMQKQSHNANALGVAYYSFIRERNKFLEQNPDDLQVRLGALYHEWMGHEKHLADAIARARDEQERVGEDALRAVGIDPKSGEYTIYAGQVLRLIGGKYWEEWDPDGHGIRASVHGSESILAPGGGLQ